MTTNTNSTTNTEWTDLEAGVDRVPVEVAPPHYPGPVYPPRRHQYYGPVEPPTPFENDRFRPKKRINDPIFLILFIVQLVGMGVLSGIVLSEYIKQGGLGGGIGGDSGTNVTLNKHTAYLLLLVTLAALLLSTGYLMLVRMYTRGIMHITLVLSILLNIGVCVYYWIEKYYSGAIIFMVIALLSIFAYFGYRSRIHISALLLKTVMDIAKTWRSVYRIAFISLILQAAYSVLYTFTAVAIYEKWTPGNPSCSTGTSCSSGKVAGLIVYATFSYLWTSQVISNVVLATLAGGPFGVWAFFGITHNGMRLRHPTRDAFLRASTCSLGSIAFGSLIVTLMELVRLPLNAVRNNANADGNPAEACLACCAEFIVGCIESALQYFNRYAYIEIALYGKPYLEAAQDTWRLFRDRGVDALANDSLVGMTLTWGAYSIGLLCSLFAYLYLRCTHPAYNAGGQYTAPVMAFAFFIGAMCTLTPSSAIEAGVSTIFLKLAEDPRNMGWRAPMLERKLKEDYPEVMKDVPRT
ncbi:DUF580-domain-containing protein [Obba rivulosa]|uniref:Protein PNS1 n=1 Tax=Obba rivulosa TaxID=1052685 RepID=A0A8E2ALY2_9APHY|nr:DUF580-domain-containing protein [Obba rivulosa]